MAKVLNIPYFVSDEGNIQSIIDKYLNTGTEYDIQVVRVEYIVKWIKDNKECGIGRKTAKALWRSSGKALDYFDKYIWNRKPHRIARMGLGVAFLFGNKSFKFVMKYNIHINHILN